MKTNAMYTMLAMLLTMVGIAACSNHKNDSHRVVGDSVIVNKTNLGNEDFVVKHLAVDKHQIMPYVTCSEQAVDSLLAIADTVFSRTDTYKLSDLDMGAPYMNDYIQKAYNDTIPLVLSIFDTYARIVNSEMDEASAAFVWHEVATMLMKDFLEKTGGKWNEPNSSEAIFRIIDDMMRTYDAGSQYDMNAAAWRSVMPIDYRLITAYKQLIDLCKDTQVAKLVNDDYMYTLSTFHDYCSSSDESYSDLPREQGNLLQLLLDSKRKYVQRLMNRCKQRRVNVIAVKKCLREHRVIAYNHERILSESLLEEFHDSVR